MKTLDDLRSFLLSDTCARFSTQDAPALVPIGLTKEEAQDPSYLQGTVNPVTMDQIREMTPNYPLAEIMERDGWSEAERINVLQPDALKELDALFTEENAEALRDKILVNILLGSMQYLDEAAYREYIKQYMEFYGLTQAPADETRAYTSTRGMSRDSFGRLYVRQYLQK